MKYAPHIGVLAGFLLGGLIVLFADWMVPQGAPVWWVQVMVGLILGVPHAIALRACGYLLRDMSSWRS